MKLLAFFLLSFFVGIGLSQSTTDTTTSDDALLSSLDNTDLEPEDILDLDDSDEDEDDDDLTELEDEDEEETEGQTRDKHAGYNRRQLRKKLKARIFMKYMAKHGGNKMVEVEDDEDDDELTKVEDEDEEEAQTGPENVRRRRQMKRKLMARLWTNYMANHGSNKMLTRGLRTRGMLKRRMTTRAKKVCCKKGLLTMKKAEEKDEKICEKIPEDFLEKMMSKSKYSADKCEKTFKFCCETASEYELDKDDSRRGLEKMTHQILKMKRKEWKAWKQVQRANRKQEGVVATDEETLDDEVSEDGDLYQRQTQDTTQEQRPRIELVGRLRNRKLRMEQRKERIAHQESKHESV